MKCYFHENNIANGVCAVCHRAVCCGRYEYNAYYCKDHGPDDMKGFLAKMLGRKEPIE